MNKVECVDAADSKYDKLIKVARTADPARTVVVHLCDETSLRGATEAAEKGMIVPVLVGPTDTIQAVAAQHGFDISGLEIIDAQHSHAAARRSSTPAAMA